MKELPMEEPLVTWSSVYQYITNILAALGMISLSVIIGLYFSGFFTWLMNK